MSAWHRMLPKAIDAVMIDLRSSGRVLRRADRGATKSCELLRLAYQDAAVEVP